MTTFPFRTRRTTASSTVSLSDLEAALSELEERMAPLFRQRRALRETIASMRTPAALPPKTRRTETQEKIARCPRCGGRLADSEAE